MNATFPPKMATAKITTLRGPKMQCWGWEGKCDAVLEDSSDQGMKAAGWGFMQARDDFSGSGTGAYFACPIHRTDNR